MKTTWPSPGLDIEGSDALDTVDKRIELVAREAQDVHGQRARLDIDIADVLGVAERLGPGLLAGLVHALDCRGALRTCLWRQREVVVDAIGAESVQRPVLKEDVHLTPESRSAGRQNCRCGELVVSPRKEDQVDGFLAHALTPVAAIWAAATVTVERWLMRRCRKPRMTEHATMTSGSASR